MKINLYIFNLLVQTARRVPSVQSRRFTRDTFSLNLRLDRGKYVFFIGCE